MKTYDVYRTIGDVDIRFTDCVGQIEARDPPHALEIARGKYPCGPNAHVTVDEADEQLPVALG